MIVLRPQIRSFVEAGENRTLKQLTALGASDGSSIGRTVAITIESGARAEQQMLADAFLDLTLRLDPLVGEVQVYGIEEEDLRSLRERVPVEDAASSGAVDLHIAVGSAAGDYDLMLDAAGWSAGIGAPVTPPGGGIPNPIGALGAAALGAGEVFKTLFALNFPDARHVRRFVDTSGVFSFFDYRYNGANPPLEPLRIDATLVGAGGVGAGVIAALAGFGTCVSGRLGIVDHDRLSRDNINRVTYATTASVVAKRRKVDEAKEFLAERAPNLDVEPYPCRFERFKQALASRRAERRYDVVITGLDDDTTRHEVQRELPRVLIDGATGRDATLTVERVMLGRWGCLGCTRRGDPVGTPQACDELPDERAPSISFLSFLPGVLAAGELAKEASGGAGALEGAFNHLFLCGPNEDMLVKPAVREGCAIECGTSSVLRAYHEKYRLEGEVSIHEKEGGES